MQKLSTKLDWNQMLGFEQIASDRSTVGRIGAKVGGKPDMKVGAKIGGKIGGKPVNLKIGAKIGGKPAA